MRLNFSKNLRLQARVSADWFQYQLSVRYMPCVVFRPSEWMSLMNTRRPASFIVFVMPNSLAALIELMVSPPAFARPRICALLDCACSRNDEKSLADSGCFTEPTTVPLTAPPRSAMAILMTSAPAGPSMSEYRPDRSVMKPMRMTSPEICACAGADAPTIAAVARVQAETIFFSFMSDSTESVGERPAFIRRGIRATARAAAAARPG